MEVTTSWIKYTTNAEQHCMVYTTYALYIVYFNIYTHTHTVSIVADHLSSLSSNFLIYEMWRYEFS